MQQVSVSELKQDDAYALAIQNFSIKPKKPFMIGLEFDSDGDPREKIVKIDQWDGRGGNSSIQFIDFK